MTAQALDVYKSYRMAFPLEPQVQALRQWLESQTNPDGGLGDEASSVFETAAAFSAIMDANFSATVAQNALSYLLAHQQPDGSWEGNAYSTALALRALQNAKPNLHVENQDVSFSTQTTVQGEIVTITASIHNLGGFSAQNIGVRVYDGDPAQGGVQIGAEQTLAVLPAGGAAPVTVDWNTSGIGGARVIHVLVDPQGTLAERDETDNHAVATFYVSTLPDLAIQAQDFTYVPEAPSVSEPITFSLKVHNLGERTVQNFDIKLYDGAPEQGGVLLKTAVLAFADGGHDRACLSTRPVGRGATPDRGDRGSGRGDPGIQ